MTDSTAGDSAAGDAGLASSSVAAGDADGSHTPVDSSTEAPGSRSSVRFGHLDSGQSNAAAVVAAAVHSVTRR